MLPPLEVGEEFQQFDLVGDVEKDFRKAEQHDAAPLDGGKARGVSAVRESRL